MFLTGKSRSVPLRYVALFLELGSIQDPENPKSGLGLAVIVVKNERIWDHPRANTIAFLCLQVCLKITVLHNGTGGVSDRCLCFLLPKNCDGRKRGRQVVVQF